MRWPALLKRVSAMCERYDYNAEGSAYSGGPGLPPASHRGRAEALLHEYAHGTLLRIPRFAEKMVNPYGHYVEQGSRRVAALCDLMTPEASDKHEFQTIAVTLLVARHFGRTLGLGRLAKFAILSTRVVKSPSKARRQVRHYLGWKRVQRVAAEIIKELEK